MIKNYKIFTESLLDKLQGPTKDEVWKSFGYEKGFDTPEEFFLDVIKDIKVKEQTKYPQSIFWEKNGKLLFEQKKSSGWVVCDYNNIYTILRRFFDMKPSEIQNFIKIMVEKHLNWDNIPSSRITWQTLTTWD